MNGPCKDCARRTLTCHGFCKEYQDFKKKLEQVSERRAKEAEMRNYFVDSRLRKRGRRK
jgi:hypothetical protein